MLQSTFNYKDFLKTSAKGLDPADKQMAFQAVMSDSAHQREIADLKAAGLNPVLSASGGSGASSPSGSYDTEQEMKDMMALTAQSVGGAVRVASKAIDNSAKQVDKTVGKLVSGDLTVHKENPLGFGSVSGVDYSNRPGFFKPELNLLNSRPMDVYSKRIGSARNPISTFEKRWNSNKLSFEDFKNYVSSQNGTKWYDSQINSKGNFAGSAIGMLNYHLNNWKAYGSDWYKNVHSKAFRDAYKHLSKEGKKDYRDWFYKNMNHN